MSKWVIFKLTASLTLRRVTKASRILWHFIKPYNVPRLWSSPRKGSYFCRCCSDVCVTMTLCLRMVLYRHFRSNTLILKARSLLGFQIYVLYFLLIDVLGLGLEEEHPRHPLPDAPLIRVAVFIAKGGLSLY